MSAFKREFSFCFSSVSSGWACGDECFFFENLRRVHLPGGSFSVDESGFTDMMGFANFAIEFSSFMASAPLIRSNNVWP